jgi:hypothetical protein
MRYVQSLRTDSMCTLEQISIIVTLQRRLIHDDIEYSCLWRNLFVPARCGKARFKSATC